MITDFEQELIDEYISWFRVIDEIRCNFVFTNEECSFAENELLNLEKLLTLLNYNLSKMKETLNDF